MASFGLTAIPAVAASPSPSLLLELAPISHIPGLSLLGLWVLQSPGHQKPPRKALPMLSILNSSNPLLIQLLDELKAAPLLASPPEYPIKAMTPWLPAPSGPSLIRISEANSILEVFMVRRSRFFGVGWLANRLCSSQWQSLAEKLLGRS